jgi:hypothetical protein
MSTILVHTIHVDQTTCPPTLTLFDKLETHTSDTGHRTNTNKTNNTTLKNKKKSNTDNTKNWG